MARVQMNLMTQVSTRFLKTVSFSISKLSLKQCNTAAMEQNVNTKILIAFDFDGTLTDNKSTEAFVIEELAARTFVDLSKLLDVYKGQSWLKYWNSYVNDCLVKLAEVGVSRMDIEECARGIPLMNGVQSMLQSLFTNPQLKVALISDCNSVFIREILAANHVNPEHFWKILCPPSYFDLSGVLRVEPYHTNHGCEKSTSVLCKGIAMRQLEQCSSVAFRQRMYAGDSKNDICACEQLTHDDIAFARYGFQLANHMEERNKLTNVGPRLVIYNDGADLARCLGRQLES